MINIIWKPIILTSKDIKKYIDICLVNSIIITAKNILQYCHTTSKSRRFLHFNDNKLRLHTVSNMAMMSCLKLGHFFKFRKRFSTVSVEE